MPSDAQRPTPAGYEISTDPDRLDRDRIHRFLAASYWSPGIPRDVLERAIAHSLCFGVYARGGEQVGFARVITDRATHAYLADVYIEAEHRGRSLGQRLVATVLAHPELQQLRRWSLATSDAHELYRRFGFAEPAHPEWFMVIERSAQELWPQG